MTRRPLARRAPLAHMGIDVGGTKVRAGAFTRDGELLASIVRPTPKEPSRLAELCVQLVRQIQTEQAVEMTSVGIGIPGLVDHANGTVSQAVNLGIGSEPLPLAHQVSAELGIECGLENDVNAAAFGCFQRWKSEVIVYLSIGTGVAAGIVLGGAIFRGANGSAGEIGHFSCRGDLATSCGCGLPGCFEAVCAGPAIVEAAGVAAPSTEVARWLFAQAITGDGPRVAEARSIAGHLARLTYLLTLTFDPNVIIVGGGVAEAGEVLIEAISGELRWMERDSMFIQSLAIPRRLRLLDDPALVALGAAAAASPEISVADDTVGHARKDISRP